jgi:2-haloacid dehalogenase
MASPNAVVFDLGGVLVDWDPRHLYRKLFPGDEAAMEDFLGRVCTFAWHTQLDAGASFEEITLPLKARHPEHAGLIDAYSARFPEMFAGTIDGTVDLLERLHARGVPLYALTNWPSAFPPTRLDYPFFGRFRDIVVSGVEKVCKPDPRIFGILLERNGLRAEDTVYVDDRQDNTDAAAALGMRAVRFTSPEALERDLVRFGVI